MHKILVTADSHGAGHTLCRIAEQESDADAMIFLGDGLRDLEFMQSLYPNLWVYSVRGNCDYAAYAPAEGLISFDGVLFFYTHGNAYSVEYTLYDLADAAKTRGADVALFGHTHIALCQEIDGVTLFNPGSPLRPRRGEASYGVITVEDGTASFEHRKVSDL